jgi:hypothetical protein
VVEGGKPAGDLERRLLKTFKMLIWIKEKRKGSPA